MRKKHTPIMADGRGPGQTEEVVIIVYHDRKPFQVETKLTTEWDKVRGCRPEDGTKISTSRNDYNFEWSKTHEQLYWHNSGGGGNPDQFVVSGSFCEPNPPPAKIWMAPGIRAVEHVEGTRCEQVRDVSDAQLLERGYLRIDRPLLLSGGWTGKRTRNPFEVAEGDTDCRYCKFCDDHLPDTDGDLCDHVVYCDACCGYVYDTPEGHVDIDSSDEVPVRHDEAWAAGETDEVVPHKGSLRLRINGDCVESSDDHSVSIGEAAAIIADIADIRSKQLRLFGGMPKRTCACGYVIKIEKNHVRIGCATIALAEIERIAKLLEFVSV